MRHKGIFASAALAAVLCVCGVAGCAGGSADVAASCDSFTITEQQVSDYTAQFRATNGYEDDAAFATYLVTQSLDTAGWRDEVIRALAERELIQQKADELGIPADETAVDQAVEAARMSYDSDEEWAAALESWGMTEDEYRSNCELANVETQVLQQELDTDATVSDDAAQSYIESSLMDRVTRSYAVISFASESDAQAALDELSGLEGDALKARFDEIAAAQSDALTDEYSGSLGWDLAYDASTFIEGDDNLKLQPGDLYKKIIADGDVYRLYMCTGRFAFETGVTFDAIEDESLKSYITSAAVSSVLATEAQQYLYELVDAAGVQVHQMPDDVDYNVDYITSND